MSMRLVHNLVDGGCCGSVWLCCLGFLPSNSRVPSGQATICVLYSGVSGLRADEMWFYILVLVLLFSLFSLFRYPPFFLNAYCRIHTLSVLRLGGNHRIQVYSLLPYPTAFLPQDVFKPRLLTAGALDLGPSSRLHVSDFNCIFMKARCLVPKLTTRLPLRLTVFILLPANSSTDRDFFTGPFSSLMRPEPQLNTIGHRSVRANILKVIRPAL